MFGGNVLEGKTLAGNQRDAYEKKVFGGTAARSERPTEGRKQLGVIRRESKPVGGMEPRRL